MTAAVTDAYVKAEEYRSRIDKTVTEDDGAIDGQLKAVSRFIDQRMRRFFTQDAEAVARVLDGNGETKLWLPADIATTTGLAVKADLDGDYTCETTLTLNTDFWVGPSNADKGAEPRPFEWLKVRPDSSNLSVWPDQEQAVQVTAVWGWPAIPEAIKELTVAITRYLRDLEQAGATLTMQNIESTIQQSPRLNLLLVQMQDMYAKGRSF
jgi:hypothetical protein